MEKDFDAKADKALDIALSRIEKDLATSTKVGDEFEDFIKSIESNYGSSLFHVGKSKSSLPAMR
jgi:hypothetical protein